jgi:hypothetical protein
VRPYLGKLWIWWSERWNRHLLYYDEGSCGRDSKALAYVFMDCRRQISEAEEVDYILLSINPGWGECNFCLMLVRFKKRIHPWPRSFDCPDYVKHSLDMGIDEYERIGIARSIRRHNESLISLQRYGPGPSSIVEGWEYWFKTHTTQPVIRLV